MKWRERSPRKESSIQGLCQHVSLVKKQTNKQTENTKPWLPLKETASEERRKLWPGGDLHCSGELTTQAGSGDQLISLP